MSMVAMLCPIRPAAAQSETETPTATSTMMTPTPIATIAPTPIGSIEEVHRLDSGNYLVIEKSFSYGEMAMITVLAILIGVILRSNDRDKIT